MNGDLTYKEYQTMEPTEGMYKWEIEVNIKSTSKLSEVFSSSHTDALISMSDDKHSCYIALNSAENTDGMPNRDFVLLYRYDYIHQPDVKLVKHSEF